MPQDPFPEPGPDSEEPASSALPPAAEGTGPEEDCAGPGEQGLYVCLPPEQVTLAGFAQNGEADTMAPGALLAAVVETVTGEDGSGLAGCSDDQLMGVLSAARRLTARAEWAQLAAIAEFARRRDGSRPLDEFAADELAFELHLTQPSAAGQMDYASTVAGQLPASFAALAAGRIHPVHLRIIAEETSILGDADTAKADTALAGAAPGLTFGELRAAARKLVLKLDPEAARKRKDAAKRETHVRRFREDSGNAGMVARELPSDEVLASWQHIEQRAQDLRAAGLPGTLQELRVRAYLDLLQERDSRGTPGGPVPAAGREARAADIPDQGPPDTGPSDPDRDPGPSDPDPGPDGSGGPGGNSGPAGPGGPGGNGRGGRGPGTCPGLAPGTGPSLAALVTITIPWDTWQGRSGTPGEADGFGPLDGDDARDLAAAAARNPRTRWCITAVNPDRTAAAHGCLPGRAPPGFPPAPLGQRHPGLGRQRAGQRDGLGPISGGERRWAPAARRIGQPGQPALSEPAAPFADRVGAHPQLGGDRRVGLAGRRGEHDRSPQPVPVRPAHRPSAARQHGLLLAGQDNLVWA